VVLECGDNKVSGEFFDCLPETWAVVSALAARSLITDVEFALEGSISGAGWYIVDARRNVAVARNQPVKRFWYCASKPAAAATLIRLSDDMHVDLRAPVKYWLPELANYPAASLSLEELMSYQGGLIDKALGAAESPKSDLSTLVVKPGWVKGVDFRYDQVGWLAACLVAERLLGEPFGAQMRAGPIANLGLSGCAVPGEMQGDFESIGMVLGDGSTTQYRPQFSVRSAHRFWMAGPLTALAKFMAALLNALQDGGSRANTWLNEAVVSRMLTPRPGPDWDEGRIGVRWGIGVMMDLGKYPTLSPEFSPRAFGHIGGPFGMDSVLSFAEPMLGVAGALAIRPCVSGLDMRFRAIMTALLRDLRILR
jgi:CubicO group peptidase (beta-lactamase class C family)